MREFLKQAPKLAAQKAGSSLPASIPGLTLFPPCNHRAYLSCSKRVRQRQLFFVIVLILLVIVIVLWQLQQLQLQQWREKFIAV